MTDELLDIVNDDDEVIDQAMRSSVHERGWQHRGVHVFLFTREGKLLIHQRSAERAQYPSVWDCSVSEHVKAGESYREAAVRGMFEELGVRGIDVQPLVRFRMNYGTNDNEISMLFEGAVDPSMIRFDPGEIAQVEYHRLTGLRSCMESGERSFSHWFEQLFHWALDEHSELRVLETY
jgi:isopentenyl-diphosphate delta-isomerase type 1